MTSPRTISGQAALSGLRPHLRRALAPTILAIEDEAVAPYEETLREADAFLADLALRDASAPWDTPARLGLVQRAAEVHRRLEALATPSSGAACTLTG